MSLLFSVEEHLRLRKEENKLLGVEVGTLRTKPQQNAQLGPPFYYLPGQLQRLEERENAERVAVGGSASSSSSGKNKPATSRAEDKEGVVTEVPINEGCLGEKRAQEGEGDDEQDLGNDLKVDLALGAPMSTSSSSSSNRRRESEVVHICPPLKIPKPSPSGSDGRGSKCKEGPLTLAQVRALVLTDLERQGYFIRGCVASQGLDYVCYAKDPLVAHGYFLVKCFLCEKGEGKIAISPLDIITWTRQAQNVKKDLYLARVDLDLVEEEGSGQASVKPGKGSAQRKPLASANDITITAADTNSAAVGEAPEIRQKVPRPSYVVHYQKVATMGNYL
eukprot:g3757.t1